MREMIETENLYNKRLFLGTNWSFSIVFKFFWIVTKTHKKNRRAKWVVKNCTWYIKFRIWTNFRMPHSGGWIAQTSKGKLEQVWIEIIEFIIRMWDFEAINDRNLR